MNLDVTVTMPKIDTGRFKFGEGGAAAGLKPIDIWQPQPKQMELLQACGLDDALTGGAVKPAMCSTIGYGGAAFGGKTEGMIGVGLIACMTIPGVQVGYFRREFTELEGADGPIYRTREIYPVAGAKYNDQKHIWKNWPGNSKSSLHFCYCNTEKDVFRYQSWAFDILLIDEATHFSWFIIDYLKTRNRVSKYSKIPNPFSLYCTNPGNIGHNWYMQTFGIEAGGARADGT